MQDFLTYSYLLLVPTSLLFLIVSLVIANKLRKSLPYHSVTVVFLTICICHNVFLLFSASIFSVDHFFFSGEPFFLFYGPLLYVSMSTYDNQSKDSLLFNHYKKQFIAPLLGVISFLVCLLLYSRLGDVELQFYKTILYAFTALQFVVYSLFIYKKISVMISFKKSKILVLNLVVCYLFLGVVYFLQTLSLYHNRVVVVVVILAISLLLYLAILSLLIVGGKHKMRTIKSVEIIVHDIKNEIKKYAKSGVSAETLEKYKVDVDYYIIQKQRFLLPDYSLEKLAEDTKINKHHISQLFSKVYHSSFTKFINQHRIEFSLALLKVNSEIPIAELGIQSGFNSRTSFFRAFKDIVGVSPSEYINAKTEV